MNSAVSQKTRLVSLDIFRGFAVAAMILVNNPGSWDHVLAPLRHATWNGCTPTDLIFPFFLIAVGISMSFSFDKYQNTSKLLAGRAILKRAALIFLVGLLLHAFPFYNLDLANFRIMGVLQRIGICFALAGLLILFWRGRIIYSVIATILILYWGIFLGFGGSLPFDPSTNIAGSIDRTVLGENHIYGGLGFPFDPEGLLGSISATASVLIGYCFGLTFKHKTSTNSLILRLLTSGVVLIGIGLAWNMFFPINKSLWTSSYVLYSAGWAAVTLAAITIFADKFQFKKAFHPFIVYGTNPLFLYVFAWVLAVLFGQVINLNWIGGPDLSLQNWIYSAVLSPVFGPLWGSLSYAILFVIVSWAVGLYLYRKRIFIKL